MTDVSSYPTSTTAQFSYMNHLRLPAKCFLADSTAVNRVDWIVREFI